MKRREFVTMATGVAAMGALGFPEPVSAAAMPTMTTVAKIVGVPYFSLLEQGLVSAGKQMGIDSSMVGPAHVDPAQQVRLVEDTIAKKVNVLGLIPLDVDVLAPVVQRARDAGIIVITQEGPKMAGRTWDVEMVNSTEFGEAMMKSLARQMGGTGQYICIVGTLTTPLHNLWCDAAIAYQKKNYPNMTLATNRFPGADEIDTTENVVRNALQAYPDLRGVIGFGSNGPIGAGNVVRQRHLQRKLSVTGFALPSQAGPLVEAGALKEVFFWNPKEVGLAMVAVASLVLKKAEFKTGMDIPGIGPATVIPDQQLISVSRMLVLNQQTLPAMMKLGV
ncbi:substrate-binding domain-containing protein [Lichenicoccus roseus]|uniref:Substrate-binding domain-containing protein n=1 Tax=Lichenicoccus roseus TaxID=2683649 RepID=A0A5R9J7S0_9PROT|nr:substrate-binding domain-containing protein [Lichenicoccus roseus]TLU71396.1 substrate-binding domain-containing protein [Lichenicoccus roseus]